MLKVDLGDFSDGSLMTRRLWVIIVSHCLSAIGGQRQFPMLCEGVIKERGLGSVLRSMQSTGNFYSLK